jgi:predicted Ser/Thr protein kinase
MSQTLSSQVLSKEADLQLGRLIGKGGFGAVHRAVWRGSNVAVKVNFVLTYSWSIQQQQCL